MKQTERFLPIGTVVTLKNGSKKVMIYTYGIYPTGKVYSKGKEVPRKKEMYEYGGCLYPEGMVDPSLVCAFNHSDIKEINHLGLFTNEHVEYSNRLNQNYDKYKKQFESQ